MNKVSEIITAWWRASNPTHEQSELAKKRLEVCMKCEYLEKSLFFESKCGECGCPMGKKIFSPNIGACRIGKWDEVDGKQKK